MAIILTTTSEQVTLVSHQDPDVALKDGAETDGLWVTLDPCETDGEAATRVSVRALSGHYILSAMAISDRGDRALSLVQRGVVSVDGAKPYPKTLQSWRWPVLMGLEERILQVSTSPMAARR